MATTSTNGNGILRASTRSLGKPSASYPGAIATDQHLAIAVDRQQTTLATAMGITDTSMTVASATQIVTWSLLSIDNEIVQVNGPATGNVVPITRGWDGTTPAIHVPGAVISGLVDAYHHNTLVAEIEAIENALGANLSKVPAAGLIMSAPFVFSPQSPGGSLIAGANAITLTPVPLGISGSDVGHYVYISGGTGTAEAAQIIGGSAVGGNPTGTLIIQCANTHSGAWTIATATGGIQEAICSLPAVGGEIIINASATLYANVGPCGKSYVQLVKLAGITLTGAFTLLGQNSSGDARTETFSYVSPNSTFGTASNVITGTSPTWLTSNSPGFALMEANVNNYPMQSMNPIQFCASGVTGAVNVPSGATAAGNGSGVNGLCSTSSTACGAVGVTGFANTLVAGTEAWGANFAVSNCLVPSGTTGVHAKSVIGLELDINVFSGGSDGAVGLQIIGLHSTTQPTASYAIEIAPLGTGLPGSVKWGSGIYFYPGSCFTAIDLYPFDSANNQGSHVIQLWSTDSGGTNRQSTIKTNPDGTVVITGGNGSPPSGVILQDGAATALISVHAGVTYMQPLPVYASNAAATAGGLTVGMLYKTSTGQVQQVY